MVLCFLTLIVCGFAFIAAILPPFAGLILKTIYQKNRQDFGMEIHCATFERGLGIPRDVAGRQDPQGSSGCSTEWNAEHFESEVEL